ncbi:MAG: hypothetical protein HKP40_10325 [Litoreibacter sp.]|nr:hypothetical protein [Litoreibacter sp.]
MAKTLAARLWKHPLEIIRCLRRMPLWVQIWMAAVLIPVNLASIFFLGEPHALAIFVLANAAMLVVAVVIVRLRGTTRLMSAPHVVCRVLLISFVSVIFARGLEASDTYVSYLWLLMMVNAVALAMDGYAVSRWLAGERNVI